MVIGEITTTCAVDIPAWCEIRCARSATSDSQFGFDCDNFGIILSIKEQSPDIAQEGSNRSDFSAGLLP